MLFNEGHALFKLTPISASYSVWNINWLCWLAALGSILKRRFCGAGSCDSSHSMFVGVFFCVLPTIWPSADNSLSTAQQGFAQEGILFSLLEKSKTNLHKNCNVIKTIGLRMDFSVLHTLHHWLSSSSVYYGSMFIVVTGHIECLVCFF